MLSLRPTPGLIPSPRRAQAFDTLATHGVLARSVDDLALFLDAVAGPDARDPTSQRSPAPPATIVSPRRITATAGFGEAPVSREVRAAFQAAVDVVGKRVGGVAWGHPACDGAIQAYKTLRQPIIRHSYAPLLARHTDQLSATVKWAIGEGEAVSAADYLAAEARRSRLYRDFIAHFDTCDLLLAPAASVLPWPNAIPDVLAIDGRSLPTAIDYLAVTFIVSLAGCPVVTLPAWTAGALPFGIQLIGPPGSDRRLLAHARHLEAECGFAFRRPPGLA